MRSNELSGQATFSFRFVFLSKRIYEAVMKFKNKLISIKEVVSEKHIDMWEILMAENCTILTSKGFW